MAHKDKKRQRQLTRTKRKSRKRTGKLEAGEGKVNNAGPDAVQWQAVCLALNLKVKRLGFRGLDQDVAPVEVAMLEANRLLGSRQTQRRLQEYALQEWSKWVRMNWTVMSQKCTRDRFITLEMIAQVHTLACFSDFISAPSRC